MDRTISLEPTRITIAFPYTDGMIARVKQIPLRVWDNDAKVWCLPRTAGMAKLAIAFGLEHKFTISGDVFTLADSKPKRLQLDRSLLYPYQPEAVDFAHQNNGTFLNADDLGLGKSLETIWYAMEADVKSMLVVCPASVLFKWQAECKRWANWEAQVVLTSKQALLNKRVTIMSYAIATRRAHELVRNPYELLVVDEAHACANQSKRTSAIQLIRADKKLFLSGTPFMNRPIELFNILNMINPMSFPNYWGFAQRYCDAHQINIGARKVWNVNGASNLDELKKKLDMIMIRRTRYEVAKDLPALTRNILPVDISNKSEYRLAEMDLRNWLKLNGKSGTANALTKLNYLRQIMGAGKVASAIELAREALQSDPNRKVVVYAHHKAVVSELVSSLREWGVGTVVGSDSNIQRQETITKFQTNTTLRALVISSAGQEGVDLFRSDTIITVELPWHNAALSQCEGRLHRNGQLHPVTSYILVARNTIDEHVFDLIQNKMNVTDALLGGIHTETNFTNEILNALDK
jgi:SWI/SNF-related matrix-associated actin-dependent regulator 1 of chromatin subfamily A